MATFLVAQQELADRLNLDQTVSANATRLKRWLNLVKDDICSYKRWKFLEHREIVTTVGDEDTGTVAVTNASATVTGSGTAFAAAHVRSFIQFEGSNEWYEITARASATEITISPAYNGDTDTGLEYKIRKVYYSLSTTLAEILDVRQFYSPIKLTKMAVQTLDLYRPDMNVIGPPRAYAEFRLDPDQGATTAKKRQITIFPLADSAYNLEVRGLKILSDLSADGDILELPVRWHPTWIDGAEVLGKLFLNMETEADKAWKKYQLGIEKMKLDEATLGDLHPVLQAVDSAPAPRFIPFPGTFQQPG